jgi:hypothetical protein
MPQADSRWDCDDIIMMRPNHDDPLNVLRIRNDSTVSSLSMESRLARNRVRTELKRSESGGFWPEK